MILGLDFDNTIVSYDEAFHLAALERGLIPPEVAVIKVAVRRHLVERGLEDRWTELQGEVYGRRMLDALPYRGVLEFLREGVRQGLDIFVISHKTRHPYRGPRHDLHEAAHGWLDYHGFYDKARIGLGRDRVFFELSKAEKLDRIAALSCSHFIDDLPEILEAPGFPLGVERLLFDPSGRTPTDGSYPRFASWHAVSQAVEVSWNCRA